MLRFPITVRHFFWECEPWGGEGREKANRQIYERKLRAVALHCGPSMVHHNRQSRRRDSSSSRGSSENNNRSDYHGKKRKRAFLSAGGDSRSPSPSRLEWRQYDKRRRGERDDDYSVNRYRIGGMMDTNRRPPNGPLPEVGKVLSGRVVKIQTFGAFVQLQGYEQQGEGGQKRKGLFGVT